jgi:hypothetical protein
MGIHDLERSGNGADVEATKVLREQYGRMRDMMGADKRGLNREQYY